MTTGSGKKILVVDDDPAISGLISAILGKDGYSVIVANCGSDGVRKAGEEHPKLVLMDITMPDMDGYEATRLIKSAPDMKDIPVIFLTGRSASEDGGRAFTSGGLTFMRKPFTAQQLRDLVSLAVQ
ncbi:MAG: response regulator [bacterium]|nr:response regulator [bacterium]